MRAPPAVSMRCALMFAMMCLAKFSAGLVVQPKMHLRHHKPKIHSRATRTPTMILWSPRQAGSRTAARLGAVRAATAGEASVTSGTLNLVKSIVGAGVLALPAGIAAFSDSRLALVPATALVLLLGVVSAYSFAVLGRLCSAYEAESYREAWEKTIGERSAWIVTACCTITPLFACLAYAIIIGDSFALLAASTKRDAPSWMTAAVSALGGLRRAFILLFSLCVLWPLCSLKSLAALAPTSALGTAGVLYTAAFMGLRACDGSYLAGGVFGDAVATAGTATATTILDTMLTPRIAVFVAMLGTAYMAHFNAPSFLADAGRNLKKFQRIVWNGFGLSVLFNIGIMTAGFCTFGGSSAGLILNNYAPADSLAAMARLLFGFSILFTYPLAFAGAKDGLRQLDRKIFGSVDERRVVAGPLALITALALVLKDVGLVVSLSGALMGSAVIYIHPAMMMLRADAVDKAGFEKKLAPIAMIVLGVISAILGVITSL